MAKNLTKAQATAALRAIEQQFEVTDMVRTAGCAPTLMENYESWGGSVTRWAIVWEEGPYDWAINAFDPYVTEGGYRIEGVVRPADVFAEPINGYVLGLYFDEGPERAPITWAEIDAQAAERKVEREAREAEEATKTKGMLASIYRSGPGCSNGGISDRVDKVVLVGPNVPRIFEPSADAPEVHLRNLNGYVSAAPAEAPPEGHTPYMAGGTFIYTSDSRWPGGKPIPLHDRTDTWADHEVLSS